MPDNDAGLGDYVWFLTIDGEHVAQGLTQTEEEAEQAVKAASDE